MQIYDGRLYENRQGIRFRVTYLGLNRFSCKENEWDQTGRCVCGTAGHLIKEVQETVLINIGTTDTVLVNPSAIPPNLGIQVHQNRHVFAIVDKHSDFYKKRIENQKQKEQKVLEQRKKAVPIKNDYVETYQHRGVTVMLTFNKGRTQLLGLSVDLG